MNDVIVTSIKGCARCHDEGHDDLPFEKLDHPVTLYVEGVGPVEASHWSACPTNGQPIMLAVKLN